MDWDVRRFDRLDSTNRYLLEEAAAGAPEGTVAVADHQTGGRGRLGRRWESPPGASLLASVLLRPELPPHRLQLCTAAMALAACEACREVAGVDASLKWPNDLVLGEGKLAGVLAEAEVDGRGRAAVVVGVGVNVDWPPPLPPGFAALGPVDREELLASLLSHLGRLHGRWDAVLGAYRERCGTLGRRVRVRVVAGSFEGTAAGVSVDGHLLVDTGAGERRTVTAADVVHVRPVAPA